MRIEKRRIKKGSIKVKTLVQEKRDFGVSHKDIVFPLVIDFLNSYDFSKVEIIIVEHQLRKNYIMELMEQHILTYFMMRFNDEPIYREIISIDPKLKSSILNFPKKCNVKEHSSKAADYILRLHKDDTADFISNLRKKDDDSDTICQLEAYLFHINSKFRDEKINIQKINSL
jgi:hypothetical protein